MSRMPQPRPGYRHSEEGSGCLHFTYEALGAATRNFNQYPVSQGGCKLGEGGFGPVYRGKLKFTDVAIKMLRHTPKVSVQEDLISSLLL